MDVNNIKTKITKGLLGEALNEAIEVSRSNNYPVLNGIVNLKRNFAEVLRKENQGIIKPEDAMLERNKISNQFMNLLDNYSDEQYRHQEKKTNPLQNPKIWLIAIVILLLSFLFFFFNQKTITGINGNNNDNNTIEIQDE